MCAHARKTVSRLTLLHLVEATFSNSFGYVCKNVSMHLTCKKKRASEEVCFVDATIAYLPLLTAVDNQAKVKGIIINSDFKARQAVST